MTHKVIRFLPAVPPSSRDADAPGQAGAPHQAGAPSTAGAPHQVTLATALHLPGLPIPRFAAVEIVWPGDAPAGPDSDGPTRSGAGDGTVEVPVDEVVVRGADALASRWAEGGERYKMMSFGRRNPALTRAEFLARWRAEAGRLGGDPIPGALRGLAYVQDHPHGDDPPFDAVNEVWFDRLDDLRRRAEWFADRPVPADLMSPDECWSLYLRETVVVPGRP